MLKVVLAPSEDRSMWKYLVGLCSVLVLVAACGEGPASVETSDAVTAITASAAGVTTTTAPPPTPAQPATTVPPTTTSTTTSTSAAPVTLTTPPPPAGDAMLPESFGTMEEFIALVERSSYFITEPDAQATSYLAFQGDPELFVDLETEPGIESWVTVTYFGDITVWDHNGVYREVDRGDESLYLGDDGEWHDNEDFEWPLMGPYYEWGHVQPLGSGCLEIGGEIVAVEDVAGVVTVRVHCSAETDDGFVAVDVWIGEYGHIMKAYSELTFREGTVLVQTWEVTGFGVHPGDPLPDGW